MSPEPVVIIPVAEYERMKRQIELYRKVAYPSSLYITFAVEEFNKVLGSTAAATTEYAMHRAIAVMNGHAASEVKP